VLSEKHGVDAIIISNHGGRQLDTCRATIEVLPEVAESVSGKMEIYIDGGIRRGTDVLKALALGAKAVLLGRPILWGLAYDGENGVRKVLQILRKEFDLAMALCGCTSVKKIKKKVNSKKMKIFHYSNKIGQAGMPVPLNLKKESS
jgi:isopentenyl diphosphate isomerase/L-lactate dehydrogenase-like FMN-dependent dehydrogenase